VIHDLDTATAPATAATLVSTRAAARRLGVCGERVRQLRVSGALPAARVGDAWVYDARDVDHLASVREAARAERAARGLRDPGRPRATA